MFTLDKYTLGARIYPVMIAMLVPTASTLWLMNWSMQTMASFLPPTAILACLALFAALVRSAGKKIEAKFYMQWGGKPTTLLLLYETSSLNKLTINGIRKKLESACEGLTFLNEEQEGANKKEAEDICEYATIQLRQKTRDPEKFSLVFKENVNYGFFRNLYAIKNYAIFLNISIIFYVFFEYIMPNRGTITPVAIYTTIANTASIFFFIYTINEEKVKEAAYTYARALLEAVESPYFK